MKHLGALTWRVGRVSCTETHHSQMNETHCDTHTRTNTVYKKCFRLFSLYTGTKLIFSAENELFNIFLILHYVFLFSLYILSS